MAQHSLSPGRDREYYAGSGGHVCRGCPLFSSFETNERLPERLVESGLTVGAEMSYYTQAHVGPISASFQTTPDKLLAAETAMIEEVGKLADPNYITGEELFLSAQKELSVRALYQRETGQHVDACPEFLVGRGGPETITGTMCRTCRR